MVERLGKREMLVSRHRENADELLDQTGLPMEAFERSLSDLEWTNRWLGGKRAVLSHVAPLVGECSDFLDVGCGSGDMLRGLSDEGKRKGSSLRLVGLDLNPSVLACARARCAGYPDIGLVRGDATALPFADGSFDVVFSSTFIHHLDPPDAVLAIREAARVSRRRVVIADLVRSNIGWIAVWLIGRFAFGRLSRRDGPVSFQRAYKPRELAGFARQAGLTDVRVHIYGCCRMALVYDKERARCGSV
jgi:ubiquinone/menaquinone biosynthesis C-methylase UbiE